MAKSKPRRIIYTDATKSGENYKIAIYDKDTNATHIVELKSVQSINEAEICGVLYAIKHVAINDISKAHIVTDNEQASKNTTLSALCKKVGCTLSWIPREINSVADKVVKLEPTKNADATNSLHLLYSIVFEKDFIIKETTKADSGLSENGNEDNKKQEQQTKTT